MDLFQTVFRIAGKNAIFIAHHDQLKRDQENARLKQHVVAKSFEKQGCYEQDQGKGNHYSGPWIIMLRHVLSPEIHYRRKLGRSTESAQYWTDLPRQPILEKSCASRHSFRSFWHNCSRLAPEHKSMVHKRRFTVLTFASCR